MRHIKLFGEYQGFSLYESYANQKDIFELMTEAVPLTPSISKLLFDNKRAKAFHISDAEQTSKILRDKFRGNSSLSCFSYATEEIIKTTKITPYTRGGILIHLEGDLLFSLNKDAMSMPDQYGRRWISNWNFPTKFRAELNRWIFSKGDAQYWNDLIKTEQKSRRVSFLREYIPFINELVKKHYEEIKEVCDMYWSTDLTQGWPIDYNEVVLSKINILGILINRPVFLKYESENRLLNIVEEWKSILGERVELIDREEDILQWFHARGGITGYDNHIRGKELLPDLLTHIR